MIRRFAAPGTRGLLARVTDVSATWSGRRPGPDRTLAGAGGLGDRQRVGLPPDVAAGPLVRVVADCSHAGVLHGPDAVERRPGRQDEHHRPWAARSTTPGRRRRSTRSSASLSSRSGRRAGRLAFARHAGGRRPARRRGDGGPASGSTYDGPRLLVGLLLPVTLLAWIDAAPFLALWVGPRFLRQSPAPRSCALPDRDGAPGRSRSRADRDRPGHGGDSSRSRRWPGPLVNLPLSYLPDHRGSGLPG